MEEWLPSGIYVKSQCQDVLKHLKKSLGSVRPTIVACCSAAGVMVIAQFTFGASVLGEGCGVLSGLQTSGLIWSLFVLKLYGGKT